MRTYDNFITQAFIGYAIPSQILRVVQPWVEQECGEGFWGPDADLGYAELADTLTFDQAMKHLANDLKWQQVEGKRAYNKYLKDAGGRVGKGFYRRALKAYYLMETAE
jgi:hypothetical protein